MPILVQENAAPPAQRMLPQPAPLPTADRKMGVLAEAVITESARGDELSEPQNNIYNEYVNTVHSLTADNARTPPPEAAERFRNLNRDRGNRREWVLPESFDRIKYPNRLKNEYEEALRTALHSSNADFNGLNAREIALALSGKIGSKVTENIVEAFDRDAAELLKRYKDWSESKRFSPTMRSRSASREDLNNAIANNERNIVKAIENYTEAFKAKLERLEPTATRKMRLVIEKAIEKTPDDDLPFAVATPLKEWSAPPPIPTSVHDASKNLDEHIPFQCLRSGMYSMLESATVNGEAIKSLATGWITSGIIKGIERAAAVSAGTAFEMEADIPQGQFSRSNITSMLYLPARKSGSSAAGTTAGIAGTINAAYALGRDFHTGYRAMHAKLHRITFKKELRDPSSLYYIARRNLALTHGARWVRDFERWSLDSRGLSLDTAATVAKELRSSLNHPPALVSEQELYHKEEECISENLQDRERRQIRGRNGSDRYKREKNIIISTLDSMKINADLANGNAEGIRCLARLDDAKPTDDAKKLHEICRKEPIHTNLKDMRASSDAFLQEKFPILASYFHKGSAG